MGQCHGRLAGTARRQVDGLVKQLQRARGGHDGSQQDGGLQQGDRQVNKLLERGSAVDAGRFVDRVVNVLQTGKIKNHVVAGPAPDQRNDDDPACRPCVLEPIHRGDAHGGQYPVDQTIVGKQGFENHRVGDKRRGAGQKNHRAVDALALDVRAVEQLRQDQCQDQHNGHLDHKIENRVKQALLERGIL